MKKFEVITIFPKLFEGFREESIIGAACQKKIIEIKIHNLRQWAEGKHKTVDDKPFGGGIGMVLKVEPIYKAVKQLKGKEKKTKVILFSPRGKKFSQKDAFRLSKYKKLIFICGRYEGVDERVAEHIADEEISIGDYVLMGGEIPAMAVIEAVARLIPGVLGKPQLLKERITKERNFLELPRYTRPEVFQPAGKKRAWKTPKVLLSGNHKEIEKWRFERGRDVGDNEHGRSIGDGG